MARELAWTHDGDFCVDVENFEEFSALPAPEVQPEAEWRRSVGIDHRRRPTGTPSMRFDLQQRPTGHVQPVIDAQNSRDDRLFVNFYVRKNVALRHLTCDEVEPNPDRAVNLEFETQKWLPGRALMNLKSSESLPSRHFLDIEYGNCLPPRL